MFDIRTQIYTKLQNQEVAYYDKYPVGRIITRITGDVDALNELFTSGVIDVLGDLVIIFAIIGMMFWLDWRLALVSLITVPLLFAATNWFRKRARVGFDMVRTRLAKLNAFLQEHISGAQTVQLFNAEAKTQEAFTTSTTITATPISRRFIITRFFIRSWISSAPSASRSSSGSAVIRF
jgi:ATP-binding cassette subfamily B protein